MTSPSTGLSARNPDPSWVLRIGIGLGALVAIVLAMTAAAPQAGAADTCTGGDCDTVAFMDSRARISIYSEISPDSAVATFYYGNPGDVSLMGDWNCDGEATPATYRRTSGLVSIRNDNSASVADNQYYFGNPGDIPVAGDFNGDGCDTVSVYRPYLQQFHITNRIGGGVADYSFTFGNPGDSPIAGDFNGNGVDTVGVHRPNSGAVHLSNAKIAKAAEISLTFGQPGDQLIVGDWNGDGVDTVGAYRRANGTLYLRNTNNSGAADVALSVGQFATANAASGIPNFSVSTSPAAAAAPAPAGPVVYDVDVEVHAGDNLASLARSHPEGTVFRIHGTLSGQEVRPRSSQVFIGGNGAVLRGNGKSRAFSSGASNVVIQGLEITGYESGNQNGAIQASGSGWIIRDNEIHHNGAVGIKIYKADRATIESNNIHHNAQLGISVAYSTDSLVEDNEIAYNNWQKKFKWGFEAGGTKFWTTTGLIVRDNWSHHNYGPGLWTDHDNTRTLYEGNLVEDNHATGIYHEISYDVVIRNNTIRRNGFGHAAWLWGGGITLSSSGGADVYGNSLSGNYNGITMVQQSRGSGAQGKYVVKNNTIRNNEIVNSGTSGAAEDIGSKAIFSAGNDFQGNTYRGDVGWEWGGGGRSWSSWRNAGLDSNGSHTP